MQRMSVEDSQGERHARAPGQPCDVSVVVPVLNEHATLETLTKEIELAFQPRPAVTFEVIFVDDGSTDGSWTAIDQMADTHSFVRGKRLRRNFGKAAALSVGTSTSHGQILVTMDADLQDDPAELPALLDALDEDVDLVTGWKRDRRDPMSKRLPSRLFNFVTGLATGVRLHDHNCGFKAARREVYEQIPLYGELHRYIPAMAHNLGYRVTEIPVNHRPRVHGSSKYGFERYVRGLLDLFTVLMLTRYGRRPGHLFGGLGVVLGVVGFIILLYLTGVWVFTDQGIGTRPLLSLGVLLEVLAIQLVSLGMLSELVLHRTPSRPPESLVTDHVGPE